MQYILFLLCLSVLSVSSCSDEKSVKNPTMKVGEEKKQVEEPKLHDEDDKTDIYAIPLDKSAMEEEAEKK